MLSRASIFAWQRHEVGPLVQDVSLPIVSGATMAADILNDSLLQFQDMRRGVKGEGKGGLSSEGMKRVPKPILFKTYQHMYAEWKA